MRKSAQITIGLINLAWALSVLVLGLYLLIPDALGGDTRVMGLAMVGASLFLVMWLVIDRLVPNAGRWFTGTLKVSAIVVFYASGVITLLGG